MKKSIYKYLQWFYFLIFQLFYELHRDKGRVIDHSYDGKCTHALFGMAKLGSVLLLILLILRYGDCSLPYYFIHKNNYFLLFFLCFIVFDEIFIFPKFERKMPLMESYKKEYNTWSTAKQVLMLSLPVFYTIFVWAFICVIIHC